MGVFFMQKKKQALAALGVVLGISASVLAIIPTAPHMQAGVIPVIDEKNIAQAIKMVNHTKKILSDQDQELLLAVLNAKKLDFNMFNKYMNSFKKQTEGADSPLSEKGMYDISPFFSKSGDGFDAQATVRKAWIERLGSLESVLNGETSIAGAAMDEIKREKALDQTFLAAALKAESAEKTNKDVVNTTSDLLDQMKNAQGVVQNIQLGNQINAQTVVSLATLNSQIASQMQAEAAHYEAKAQKRAREIAANKKSKELAAAAISR